MFCPCITYQKYFDHSKGDPNHANADHQRREGRTLDCFWVHRCYEHVLTVVVGAIKYLRGAHTVAFVVYVRDGNPGSYDCLFAINWVRILSVAITVNDNASLVPKSAAICGNVRFVFRYAGFFPYWVCS